MRTRAGGGVLAGMDAEKKGGNGQIVEFMATPLVEQKPSVEAFFAPYKTDIRMMIPLQLMAVRLDHTELTSAVGSQVCTTYIRGM